MNTMALVNLSMLLCFVLAAVWGGIAVTHDIRQSKERSRKDREWLERNPPKLP